MSGKITSFLTKRYYGLQIWLIAVIIAVIYGATLSGIIPADDMLGIVTVMFAVGFVLYEIGEHLPIWKDYIGGGAVMAFFGAAALEYFKILPEEYAEGITFFYDEFGFQTLFISLLIVSAVLSVNRRQLPVPAPSRLVWQAN